MLPYLWPKGQSAMRARVVISMIALILSKIFLIAVPYIYGEAVDILELKQGQQAALLSVPIFLVIAYAVVKIASNGFQQLRDAIFARVGQQALRQLAVKIFRHVHDLSLRFHLSRRTGGLNRIIDRGTKGIDFLLRMMLFNLVPTILEIIMVSFIMFYTFGFFYGVVTSVTVAVYVIVTYILNDWRTKYRRQMNDFDNDAGQIAY
jgi:ATP-binding cassette subfamily B protein